MTTFAAQIASGSTNGKNIKITTTASAGDTLHTAHATSLDEVWVWAMNSDTTARLLTVQFGGTTSPDDVVQITIPPQVGPVLVIPGWKLTNSLVVRAFAATANVVTCHVEVNRIT